MDYFASYAKPWVHRVLMSFIGAYVENLSQDQLSVGINKGNIDLRDLSLKKSVLDKLDLPFGVVEGRIGRFMLSINWTKKETPVVIEIEDVQVLIAASSATAYSREDEERREQQLKQERLERAEALRMGGEVSESSSFGAGYFNSIIARIVNNVQVKIKNIHLRYEDKQTVPAHPFAAGITLAGLSAVSVDADWKPKYLDASEQSIHKLATLDSLAVYFNTDSESIAGLDYEKSKKLFRDLISSDAHPVEHQFILRPVSGEGRVILNKQWGNNGQPHYDAQLLFNELGFNLDNHQYRDVISLADEYHIFVRQHKYRKYRPDESEFEANKSKALWKFATVAIREEVHDKHVRWTWEHFRTRRDERHRYVDLFKQKELENKSEEIVNDLASLERKLSYNDIRFYRSIARSQLKKDKSAARVLEQNKKKQQSWSSWLWGTTNDTPKSLDQMTEEEKKGLNEFLDYDERAELAEAFDPSRETISTRAKVHLKQGSFRLKRSPSDGSSDIVSLVFDSFDMGGVQRRDNFEASLSLGNFRVFDGTTTNDLYKQIVHVKESEKPKSQPESSEGSGDPSEDAFFYMKYEFKPLDERADNGLTVKLRSMEILYQRGYVEAIVAFFKPPESQLQSVEALLSVAGETLGGIQKETRAGLEYALETHKTVDLRLDMHAPIIIIPESVTSKHCNHLVIDAGRVLVESTLASKETIREIEKKRKTKYTDEDYKQLESMMYDNYSVKLVAAQFVIGDSLDACRSALQAEEPDPRLHLLERVNIDLLAQNSIVPSARSIARLKMSGRLPNLHVNFSDSKYKTLMRLLDVSLPRLDDDSNASQAGRRDKPAFQPSVELFGSGQAEYVVDDVSVKESEEESDASGIAAKELSDIRQHQFELSFRVDSLQATISRTAEDGSERALGNLALDHFLLNFVLAKYEMKVDIDLKAIDLKSSPAGYDPLLLVSTESDTSEGANLMNVAYRRAQKASPDFLTIYDGYDQSVDVTLTTFVVRAVPEHVLSLYDYIMTTFVPSRNGSTTAQVEETSAQGVQPKEEQSSQRSPERIRVRAKLAEFQVLLLEKSDSIATMSLSTANVDVDLEENGLVVIARLGSLKLTDDSPIQTRSPEFKHLLSIKGDELAELRYESFSPAEAIQKGINSSVNLTTGSLKLHFLEAPLNSMYLFLMKFARLKGLYDAATEVAVQRAAQVERMAFHLSVRSPIVVFPVDPTHLEDVFVLRLGELSTQNEFDSSTQLITGSLNGIQLTSLFFEEGKARLNIIDDVNVSTEITQAGAGSYDPKADTAEFKTMVRISDVNLKLTELQYCRLITLSQAIPGVFSGSSESQIEAPQLQQHVQSAQSESQANLLPELSPTLPPSGQVDSKKVDLVVTMQAVNLHLYDSGAISESDLKSHGITKFTLSGTTMTLDMRTSGALQSQLWIKAFTMNNIRPGPTKFREIIPAADHGRDQFHCLFTSSGGSNSASQIVATIDSPHIIFSIEPIFALSNFFLSAFSSEKSGSEDQPKIMQEPVKPSGNEPQPPPLLSFRFDLYDTLISVLEDDQKSDTQAVRLSLSRLSLSQQNAMVLDMSRLGMSLLRMNKQAETVRFLDDVDIKLASESRSEWNKQFTGINIVVEQEFVFRASYRDILLITAIANKALALFSGTDDVDTKETKQAAFDNAANAVAARSKAGDGRKSSSSMTRFSPTRSRSNLAAKVIMSTEEMEASFQGLRLVLIGDLHEAPVLHMTAKAFTVSVNDWSTQLQARTTIPLTIDYWNLKNSHWEPLIDPWNFSIKMHKIASTGGISLDLSSTELLDLNVSSNFVELAITTANIWNKEGDRVLERARGSYAPYRICNRTGSPVYVWPDSNGNASVSSANTIKVDQGSTIDWRFDDWRKTREDGMSSTSNAIGVRFDAKPWENLRSVPVDREGQFIYSLRPRTRTGYSKLMCEIVTKDNVKIVTLRSTYKVENQTFYPLEITLVDDTGHPVYPIEKIVPGDDYVLPIEAVIQNRIRIQPDAGFGYRWSQPMKWEDFRDVRHTSGLTVRCPHTDRKEAPFHFTVCPVWSSQSRDYPEMKLNLRAPIELENLLPFDIRYKVFDKDTNHNWNSFLRKGGNTPVHSVELSHLVLLSVTIEDTVFKASDFTIINADRRFEFDQEHQISLADPQGRKLNLMLNYIKFPDAGGAFKVQIYSPFIVVNKTGLPFGVKCVRSAGLHRDVAGPVSRDDLTRSTPFLLSHINRKGNEFVFKVGESSWSQTMRFDAPSAEAAMVIPHVNQKAEINVGLSWAEGTGKYKLSKVIELTPRFFIYNKLPQPIQFREVAAPPSGELNPGDRAPLHFMRLEDRRLLTIAYPGLNTIWSSPINMEAIGTVHVRMRPAGSTSEQVHLVDANVVLDKATIFVILSAHEGPWPFMIENQSSHEVTIGQIDEVHERPEKGCVYKVTADSRLPYAWDFPAMEKKKLYLSCNKRARKIDIMEIGVLPPLRHNGGTIALDVRADGPSQLLTITDYREETSIYKPRRLNSGANLSRSDSIATTQEFEAVQEEIPPTLSVTLDFKGLGISLLNKRLIEVVYISTQNVKLEYHNSPVAQSANLAIGTLQIDNQLHDAYFPVLLQPTPIAKEDRSLAALPTVQASVIILNDSAHGVLFVKYASILLQALTIQIDEGFLYAILDLTKLEGVTWETEEEGVLVLDTDKVPEPQPVQPGQDVYFEVLELQPIFLSVSFVRNINPSGDDAQAQAVTSRNPLAVVLNVLTMTLANAEGIELQLNALGITDVRLTLPEFQSRILYHYRQEVLRQIYRVLGAADFLGNPVGLFTNVSSGVADIFYEPWHGVVQRGGGELGIGLAKGAASFVKKTIFGLSDSMTKITSSVGKGLSAATLDADFQAKRRMNQRRNKPRHALTGVASGAGAFASSVASGVEGVLMKPLEGADAEGALGFFKGMGKGFVGVVTKPVVGVFDLASNVAEGVRNTTTVFDAPQRDRVRKPRQVPADGVLEPYSPRKAVGQSWMRDLSDGVYRKDYYIAHIDNLGSDNIILLTNARILSFSSRGLHLHWEMPLTTIAGVQGESTGIRFVSKAGHEQDRFVIIQDSGSKEWFFEQVKAVVMSFNARRRLER
ncbi:vacuolar protein sorting-associated protein vps13 [Fomitiporia mediterranea MF3/22]|uniref:vacuolar protein sorting-associated protein vps13 n=1 Tax=Fomitiporia mediterranea (strain MF3/22) TaxID=694068 RepID=UPI000440935B|nr:vacuolar protein sorting-associated protein vps13 [Fomitiporia mediterranea MF3/22]EJD03959.1 vacuolar protein sorting-associated protein vps13 [Fomitiporia mediterranea MF3/22]